eukprot:1033334-Prorocentrum_minimum.AAC.1
MRLCTCTDPREGRKGCSVGVDAEVGLSTNTSYSNTSYSNTRDPGKRSGQHASSQRCRNPGFPGATLCVCPAYSLANLDESGATRDASGR